MATHPTPVIEFQDQLYVIGHNKINILGYGNWEKLSSLLAKKPTKMRNRYRKGKPLVKLSRVALVGWYMHGQFMSWRVVV